MWHVLYNKLCFKKEVFMKLTKRIITFSLVLAMLFSAFTFLGANNQVEALSPLPHLLQSSEPWGSHLVGGYSISRTGCGILSLVNCVGYLTGKRIDVIECAEWAYSVKGFNNYSNSLGTYRLVLYPLVEAKYGAEYGFTVDCNTGDSGWWVSDASSKVLKNHLANGGVAIGMIPGHFIAMVDYDATTNKFHVLDSAPTANRGTLEKNGDVWLPESHFTTAAGKNYQLQWFCLLSATGTPADEQDNEKEYLEETIASVKDCRYDSYSETALATLRNAYDNAVTVLNSSSSKSEDYKNARLALEKAINFTPSVSVGKIYTATATNRGDDYDDDGKKLTDGKKGTNNPELDAYAGWKNKAEIVVDLGEVKTSNYYNTYLAGGDWGIEVPKTGQFNVAVYASADGTNYSQVATGNVVEKTKVNGAWTMLKVTADAKENVSARYIKFVITCTAKNNYIWIDEVEVCSGEPLLANGVYINKINAKVDGGDCVVYTPSFGKINASTTNYAYTRNIIMKWDNGKEAYVVTKVGDGSAVGSDFTLAEGEVMVAVHDWETGVSENIVEGSAVNFERLKNAKVGDSIYFNGVDFSKNSIAPAPYLTIYSESVDEPTPPEEGSKPDIPVPPIESEDPSDEPSKDPSDDPSQPEPPIDEPINPEPPFGDEVKMGDINENGDIDSMDYVLLKRAYFGTYRLSDITVGDIDENGEIGSMDYVYLRRAYFGTYVIK